MYSDRLEDATKRSIKERLNGTVVQDSACRRPVTGKRQRQDDKWEHDLFGDKPQLSRPETPTLGARDLRLKLQKRSTQQAPQCRGVCDLREKLSGSMNTQPLNVDPPKPKRVPEATKPIRRSVIGEAPVLESRKVPTAVIKKSQKKADTSVDVFLQSLGLEKYQIQFQAEEVDMTALEHLTDEDLKTMGIPMQAIAHLVSGSKKEDTISSGFKNLRG